MFPHGLSAFDVHEQTEVFAAYVAASLSVIHIADVLMLMMQDVVSYYFQHTLSTH